MNHLACTICTPYNNCPIGSQLWAIETAAHTDFDEARRALAETRCEHKDETPFLERVAHTKQRLLDAQAAFDRHTGDVRQPDTQTLDLAMERVFLVCRAFPAELAIVAAELLVNRTPAPTWTRTPTPPPLYTDGAPQEPELDA